MHRASLATFTMLAAVALISGARAGSPPQYTARFITPGIDAINASAMNSAGDVVGTGTTGSGAWVSRAGAPAVLLPLPSGAQYAVANDINEAGVIVGGGFVVQSGESIAVILTPVGGGECAADLTGDAVLDLFDFLEFTNLFNAGDPAADFTGDGMLDLFDFLAFTNDFNAGC